MDTYAVSPACDKSSPRRDMVQSCMPKAAATPSDTAYNAIVLQVNVERQSEHERKKIVLETKNP